MRNPHASRYAQVISIVRYQWRGDETRLIVSGQDGRQGASQAELGVFFGALPIACFGLYMTYGFCLAYQKQWDASVSYEPVSAKILSAQVETTSQGTPRTSGSTRVYQRRILYDYEVNGRTYRSHKYSYTFGVYGSAEEVQAVIDRYPVGSEQTAYFNPDKPAAAVLRRASPQPWWEYFWFPVVFDAFCFLAMLAGWRGWLGKSR